MNLNADHFFQIGTGHKVCQDFALSGVTKDFAYAIVCDGCSGSKDVDTGARLLAYAARTLMRERLFSAPAVEVGHVVIRLAEQFAKFLPKSCLDATLQFAMCKPNGEYRVIGFGDGVQCKIDPLENKQFRPNKQFRSIEYKENQPFYLSNEHLHEAEPMDFTETYRWFLEGGENRESFMRGEIASKTRQNWSGTLEKGESIVVTSDGIHTFSQCQDGISTEPDWALMLDELTNFKGANVGPFVERRFQMFNRKAKREGISHYDDLAMAAIHYF